MKEIPNQLQTFQGWDKRGQNSRRKTMIHKEKQTWNINILNKLESQCIKNIKEI